MNQEELSRRVSTIVERGIAQGQIAGACVGVYQNQEELLCEAYGLADRESGRAMQTDALFRIFSMTKPVTAVATMMLWEQGVLELRDPVHWYIPSFRDKLVEQDGALVPAQEEITIQHLLNMTSGIPYPGWGSESLQQMSRFYAEISRRRFRRYSGRCAGACRRQTAGRAVSGTDLCAAGHD